MGTTYKSFIVKREHTAKKQAPINFLIDSGAVYSLVPANELKKLGIAPYRTVEFILADGSKIERKVGDAYFEYQGEGGAAPVIFGEKGDEPLLGVTALESIGRMLNPFKKGTLPYADVVDEGREEKINTSFSNAPPFFK